MPIYIGIGLALIVIAGLVYSAMGGEKTTAVTFDDMGASESSSKSKKSDSKSSKSTADSKSSKKSKKKAKEEEDWEDEAFDLDALHQEIDKAGLTKTLQGTLEPE